MYHFYSILLHFVPLCYSILFHPNTILSYFIVFYSSYTLCYTILFYIIPYNFIFTDAVNFIFSICFIHIAFSFGLLITTQSNIYNFFYIIIYHIIKTKFDILYLLLIYFKPQSNFYIFYWFLQHLTTHNQNRKPFS